MAKPATWPVWSHCRGLRTGRVEEGRVAEQRVAAALIAVDAQQSAANRRRSSGQHNRRIQNHQRTGEMDPAAICRCPVSQPRLRSTSLRNFRVPARHMPNNRPRCLPSRRQGRVTSVQNRCSRRCGSSWHLTNWQLQPPPSPRCCRSAGRDRKLDAARSRRQAARVQQRQFDCRHHGSC